MASTNHRQVNDGGSGSTGIPGKRREKHDSPSRPQKARRHLSKMKKGRIRKAAKEVGEMRCKNHEELGWDDSECPTCKSLNYHNSIYQGLESEEALQLYKQRTLMAFGGGK